MPFDQEDLKDRDEARCVQKNLEALPVNLIEQMLAEGEVIE